MKYILLKGELIEVVVYLIPIVATLTTLIYLHFINIYMV